MKITILSCSLDQRSKSHRLAQDAESFLVARGVEVRLVDCRSLGLPDFDHAACYASPAVLQLTADLAWADGIVLAMPIYNWGGNSVAKKVIEATGADETGRRVRAWEDKVVTFLCAAGLPQSYMAYLPLANGLMLDYKCIINPHLCFAVGENFGVEDQLDEETRGRLERALSVAVELTEGLRHRTILSGWCI